MTGRLVMPSGQVQLQPRPYQIEALEALDAHLKTKQTNPCVVIPTGGGKSVFMAWAIMRWKQGYPPLRVCILAHRKELVDQNSGELEDAWPGADVGVYSAGLHRRDTENSIIYASIDSVFNRGGEFAPFDVIIVDEAHRIPPKGEGKYRTFINIQQKQNPRLRVVGLTATPYRMTGPLCHKDHILQEVCYEARIFDLISQGYLCRLWSRRGDEQPDLHDVKRNSGGDYVVKSLADAVDTKIVVSKAVADAVANMKKYGRSSAMFFCVDVEHCKHVSQELRLHGIIAPPVTASTSRKERDRIASEFKAGRLHAICNVNVYTEGFNAKQVDCIVLLRPTLSKGLYVQMVGRGLRVHPAKSDCLILDYAHCIDEHGPIDCIGAGRATLEDCRDCGNTFSRQLGSCPHCGWVIPREILDAVEAAARERKLHEISASQRSILSGEPEELKVDSVDVDLHVKLGKPNSVRVSYRCGLDVVREWICFDHTGPAKYKAAYWWKQRMGEESPVPTVAEAAENMILPLAIADCTESITVVRRGKHREITDYKLRPIGKRNVLTS